MGGLRIFLTQESVVQKIFVKVFSTTESNRAYEIAKSLLEM